MAILTTTINGTDSVSSSRITINDNFNTIVDALNDVLTIIDISTGKINNYNYGSNNDIETEDLIVRGSGANGGISVLSGNVSVNNGNVVIGGVSSSGFLQVGGGNNAVFVERISRPLNAGSIPTVNLSGATAGNTASTPVGYVSIPRLDTASLNAIQNPTLGSIAFNWSTGKLVVCTATSMAVGATGTWTAVH